MIDEQWHPIKSALECQKSHQLRTFVTDLPFFLHAFCTNRCYTTHDMQALLSKRANRPQKTGYVLACAHLCVKRSSKK